jgi:hypothetical protein
VNARLFSAHLTTSSAKPVPIIAVADVMFVAPESAKTAPTHVKYKREGQQRGRIQGRKFDEADSAELLAFTLVSPWPQRA